MPGSSPGMTKKAGANMPFLREKSGRASPEKIAAFAIAIAPALWLAGLVALDQLGARPVTEALHFLGRSTVRLVLAALLITPARRILNWGTLHKAVYVIGVFAVVHFALQKKLDIYEPTLMMGFLAWLLAYRALYKWRREVGLAGLVALAFFAMIFTMLFEALWYGALTGVSPARVIALNFLFAIDVRPAWWVLAASLAVIAVYLVAQWLRPRAPARLNLHPAE